MRRTWSVLAGTLLLGCLVGSLPGADATSTSKPAASGPSPASQPTTGRVLMDPKRARQIEQLNGQALECFKSGKYEQCKKVLNEQLRLDPQDSTAWYNMACAHSRLGEVPLALECLRQAVELGFGDLRHMQRDEDLVALRDTEGYKKLLSRNDEIQAARAKRIEQQLKAELGEKYLYEIDSPRRLVFATNIDRPTLQEVKGLLTDQAKALWGDLFGHRFEQYVTIIVLSEKDASSLSPTIGGYYRHETHTLIARQIGASLTHEFTHALHGADQDALGQEHPIWIVEGLGALFETARIRGGHMVPQPNNRLNVLQHYVTGKSSIPFKDFFKLPQGGYMQRAQLCYAQGRYIMMYLYQKGLLKKWYDAYTTSYETDKTGAAAMEKVCGKKLQDVEADWLKWVGTLKAPAMRVGQSYLGIVPVGAPDGVRIAQVLPGSGAERAGLKANDVILRVDGLRVIDTEKLIAFVADLPVGRKVSVNYRRGEEHFSASVVLKAVPVRIQPKPNPNRRRPQTLPSSAPASQGATMPAKSAA